VSERDRLDIIAWLRLTLVPGLSLAAQRALLRHFGEAQAIFRAPPETVAGVVGAGPARVLGHGPDPSLLDKTLRWLDSPRRHLLTLGDADYPRQLLEIPDPPSALFALGHTDLLKRPGLAIVGSRNATAQGLENAHAFARALSDSGLCIVSGMAHGIDAAAHWGGLEGRSSSIAVLGTGPDIVYPRRNRKLAALLEQGGCLVTEFCPGTPPLATNFPRRNRLISGLARGVLVVEAAARSGSLVTANLACAQGRDVFAIPGSIHSSLSRGCHRLIQQGAALVENASDILAELGIPAPIESRDDAPEATATSGDAPLLRAMGLDPFSVDDLAARTGFSVADVAARMSRLEIEGTIAAVPGGRFQRCATPIGRLL